MKKTYLECISLQTVTWDKIKVNGKVNLNITFRSDPHHVVYVAKNRDKFILLLDCMTESNFKLDFKNNHLHSRLEDTAKFKHNNTAKFKHKYKT